MDNLQCFILGPLLTHYLHIFTWLKIYMAMLFPKPVFQAQTTLLSYRIDRHDFLLGTGTRIDLGNAYQLDSLTSTLCPLKPLLLSDPFLISVPKVELLTFAPANRLTSNQSPSPFCSASFSSAQTCSLLSITPVTTFV